MSKVVVALEEKDLVELQAILLDRDQAAALRFLDSIAARLPQKKVVLCAGEQRNPFVVRSGKKS